MVFLYFELVYDPKRPKEAVLNQKPDGKMYLLQYSLLAQLKLEPCLCDYVYPWSTHEEDSISWNVTMPEIQNKHIMHDA